RAPSKVRNLARTSNLLRLVWRDRAGCGHRRRTGQPLLHAGAREQPARRRVGMAVRAPPVRVARRAMPLARAQLLDGRVLDRDPLPGDAVPTRAPFAPPRRRMVATPRERGMARPPQAVMAAPRRLDRPGRYRSPDRLERSVAWPLFAHPSQRASPAASNRHGH